MGLRSRRYGWYVLALLGALNFLNYTTRNLIFTMYEDLREVFEPTNQQLGGLGSAYMLAQALFSIPFGFAADRLDRRRVLAVGAIIWTAANLASSLAGTYEALVLSRVLAGIGTAACVPIANAILCDVFPPEAKARMVAVLNLGLFLGGAAGFAFGSELGFPNAFVVLVGPGLVVAAAVFVIDVPARGGGGVLSSQSEPLHKSAARFVANAVRLYRIPSMRWMVIGATLVAYSASGYVAWFADFLAGKGFSGREVIFTLGTLVTTGGLAGVLVGGFVADYLRRTREHGRLLAICIGLSAAVPCALVGIFIERGVLFFVVSWLLMFFGTWYHGPMAASVDDVVEADVAAMAQASFLFVMHLVGTATAPFTVGLLVDRYGVDLALLAPTAALALSALAFAGGFGHIGRDAVAAHR